MFREPPVVARWCHPFYTSHPASACRWLLTGACLACVSQVERELQMENMTVAELQSMNSELHKKLARAHDNFNRTGSRQGSLIETATAAQPLLTHEQLEARARFFDRHDTAKKGEARRTAVIQALQEDPDQRREIGLAVIDPFLASRRPWQRACDVLTCFSCTHQVGFERDDVAAQERFQSVLESLYRGPLEEDALSWNAFKQAVEMKDLLPAKAYLRLDPVARSESLGRSLQSGRRGWKFRLGRGAAHGGSFPAPSRRDRAGRARRGA